jgi:hypothetical protein
VTRQSALYRGRLSHARFEPRPHAFSYQVDLLYLDLDELPALLAEGPLRTGRLSALRFERRDYLGGAGDLAEAARDRAAAVLGWRPAGPVRLLTQVRVFGRVFNPVSFYYCFAPDGRTLEAVVAEITNTPWGERPDLDPDPDPDLDLQPSPRARPHRPVPSAAGPRGAERAERRARITLHDRRAGERRVGDSRLTGGGFGACSPARPLVSWSRAHSGASLAPLRGRPPGRTVEGALVRLAPIESAR